MRKKTIRNNQSLSYAAVNLAVLGFVLYSAVWCFFFRHIREFLPDILTTCSFQSTFGKPCPLCGITRGLESLMRGDFTTASRLNLLSVPAGVILAIEMFYRGGALVAGFRREIPPWVIRWDVRTHLGLLAVYACYAALFTVAQFS